MSKTSSRWFASLVVAAIVGCSGPVETGPVALSELPSPVVKAAQKKLPDVSFDSATKETAGKHISFTIVGKDKKGKPRELKISREGKVLETK